MILISQSESGNLCSGHDALQQNLTTPSHHSLLLGPPWPPQGVESLKSWQVCQQRLVTI